MSYKLKLSINREKVPKLENKSISLLYDKCIFEKIDIEKWPQWLHSELVPKITV
jgi:hypothetical protein